MPSVRMFAAALILVAPAVATFAAGAQTRAGDAIETASIAPEDAACGAAAAAPTDAGRCLAVRIDHLRRFSVSAPVGALLIGNPAVADATPISATEIVITAKSVGGTNMILLDQEGRVLADLTILVLDSPDRRVVLRRGPAATANYQCAPRCERTLSLSDSPDAHSALSGVISNESAMSRSAAAPSAASD